MKKVLFLFSVLTVFLFVSCDNGSTSVDPATKVVNVGSSTIYFNFVDDSSGSNLTVGNWLTATAGQTTSYESYKAGTYYIAVDSDTDHSTAQLSTNKYTIDSNKTYTLTINGSSFVFSQD